MSDYEDSDDSEVDEGRAVLAYDPNQLSGSDGPPQNGHDYLKFVQDERIKYPAVCYSSKPLCKLSSQEDPPNQDIEMDKEENEMEGESLYDKQSSSSTITTQQSTCETQTNTKTLLIDNCDEIIRNFKELREKIEKIRATYPQQLQINQQEAGLLSKSLTLEKYNNGSTYVESGDNDVDDELITKTNVQRQLREKQLKRLEEVSNNLLKSKELGKTPKVSELIKLSQMELQFTLDKLADEYEIMPQYSEIPTDWIYSIMAALREPIEADICSTLRRLARLCIAKRDRYNKLNCDSSNEKEKERMMIMSNNKEYTSSLLIICIVHYYFGQTDLK